MSDLPPSHATDADPAAPPAEPAPPAPDLPPAATAAQLAALFPAVFAAGAFKPLKLRIQADIQQRAPGQFSKKSLSVFLHRHTTGTAYLKALAAAPHRADLDGLPAGEVAEEHRAAAIAELARRRASHDERRAAERAAQREAREAARRAHEAYGRARSERAALLRAYETTTLTRANFCALKAVRETELDALLAQARLERTPFAAAPHVDAQPRRQQARDRPGQRQRRPGAPPRRDGAPPKPGR